MNLHPKRWHYDTVVAEGSPEGKYKLCRLSGVFWNERRLFCGKSRDVEIRSAVGVYNTGGKRKEV